MMYERIFRHLQLMYGVKVGESAKISIAKIIEDDRLGRFEDNDNSDARKSALSSDLVSRASKYAECAHQKANHTYDGRPYVYHLQMVYGEGCRYIHLLPNADTVSIVLSACWLHDTIEDCRLTYNDVRSEFGVSVADIVYALTNEKGKTREERANSKYYQGINNTPYAAYVKVCDRIANVKHAIATGSRMLSVYRNEDEKFRGSLLKLDLLPMFTDLHNLLNQTK